MSPRSSRRCPETVSVDEGACGQLVSPAAGRRTVPSEPGEPSRDGWASASARLLLGKEPRGPSWTRGALGVRAGMTFTLGAGGPRQTSSRVLGARPSGTWQDALNLRQGRGGGKRLP